MSVLAEPPVRTERIRRKFSVDFAATKSAETEDGTLELRGYASTWVQDRDGDWMDPGAFDKHLPNYLKKNPILLHQHNMRQPLGTVDIADVDAAGLRVICSIPKPEEGEEAWKFSAYHDVRRGILKTFSVGGFFFYDVENIGEENERWIIREVELLEISVVSIPSNPDSIFEAAVKAVKDSDDQNSGERMADQAFAQMLQLLGIEEVSDPQLAAMDDEARERRWKDLAGLYGRVKGRTAPERDAYRRITGPLESPAATLEEKLAALPQVQTLMEDLYGPPTKAAAPRVVLAKSHAEALREARDLIDRVLGDAE